MNSCSSFSVSRNLWYFLCWLYLAIECYIFSSHHLLFDLIVMFPYFKLINFGPNNLKENLLTQPQFCHCRPFTIFIIWYSVFLRKLQSATAPSFDPQDWQHQTAKIHRGVAFIRPDSKAKGIVCFITLLWVGLRYISH